MAESRFARLQSYFLAAIDLEGEARKVYMEHLENEDPSIAAEINELLASHSEADTFFSDAMTPPEVRQVMSGVYDAFASEKTLPTPSTFDSLSDSGSLFPLGDDGIPDQIGPYPVLEKLGAGGMGEVYLVQETDPVKKKVALKVLNQAHISKDALARFRAEAQALALMQHHNIAQLYQYEARDPRLAYFTMEYIVGQPIHIYCEQLELTVEARLQLFLQVCDGVFHAHQKGIIHRDLKPNNILIATQDDHPVAKVIDFGIAKAVEGEGRDAIATMMTVNNALVGTPAYMPPEQVAEQAGKSHDVDTRSDIYSMGAILYQLLTDQTLIDPFIFRQMNWGQRIDMLRNPQVKKPSACLGSLGEVKSIAENRGLSAKGLVQKLSGDLDLVIMKCLAIDPDERYASVDQLRGDIQAWLAGRPVSVMPPSTVYRLKKYVKRNRGPVLAGALVLLSLVIGLSAALVSRQNAVEAREMAVQAQGETESALKKADAVQRFLQSIIASPDPYRNGPDVKLVDVLREAESSIATDFAGQPEVEARIRYSIGRSYESLGLFHEALAQMEIAYKLMNSVDEIPIQLRLSLTTSYGILKSLTDSPGAQTILESAANIAEVDKSVSLDSRLAAYQMLAGHFRRIDEHEKAVEYFKKCIYICNQEGIDPSTYRMGLAKVYSAMGKYIPAEDVYKEIIEKFKDDKFTKSIFVEALISLCQNLRYQNKLSEMKIYLDQAYPICMRIYGDNHYQSLILKAVHVHYLYQVEKYEEALVLAEEVYDKRRLLHGDNNSLTLESQHIYVTLLAEIKPDIKAVEKIIDYVSKLEQLELFGTDKYLAAANNVSYFYNILGEYRKSFDYLNGVVSGKEDQFSSQRLMYSYFNLGEAMFNLNDYSMALEFFEKGLKKANEAYTDEKYFVTYASAKVGQVLFALGRKSEAKALVTQAFEYHKKIPESFIYDEVMQIYQTVTEAEEKVQITTTAN